MRAHPQFQSLPRSFWANVRTIGEAVGYTVRGKDEIRVPTVDEIIAAYTRLNLAYDHIADRDAVPTSLGRMLLKYLNFRARRLKRYVEPRLMDVERARNEFEQLRCRLNTTAPIPMNKQTGKKKAPAYLTGIVNMLIEANAPGMACDFSPRRLTTVTDGRFPLRTLARRLDGAFPSVVNPIAVWEIKEYYYTTTFGSRVADAIYETLLDGLELEELREHEGIEICHYLIVDGYYTWWECGKSYLCRLVDLLHMGLVDEVLFGYEVIERLPRIVRGWLRLARDRRGYPG